MSRYSSLRLMQRVHYCVEVKGSRLLPRRILHVVFDLGRNDCLALVKLGYVIDHPIKISVGVVIGALEGIAAQVEDMRKP